jgi:hypothetical protein
VEAEAQLVLTLGLVPEAEAQLVVLGQVVALEPVVVVE